MCIRDRCISDYSLSRTQMVFDSLDSICYEFNLEKPMWLDSTVKDFKYHDKARFTQDNFCLLYTSRYVSHGFRKFSPVFSMSSRIRKYRSVNWISSGSSVLMGDICMRPA